MGMSAGSAKEGEPMMEINTTPFDRRDVGADRDADHHDSDSNARSEVEHAGGQSAAADGSAGGSQIDVDFDGTIFWNGETVAGREPLEQRLGAAAATEPQPEIHLRGRTSWRSTKTLPWSWPPRNAWA